MTEPVYPLFVYGTLKPGGMNYPIYLEGHTEDEQPASLRGAALYTEGQFPYLVTTRQTILVHRMDRVSGTLMVVRPEVYSDVLHDIDALEEFIPGDPLSWYQRIVAPVETGGGPVMAWVYIAGAQVLSAIEAGIFPRFPKDTWPVNG